MLRLAGAKLSREALLLLLMYAKITKQQTSNFIVTNSSKTSHIDTLFKLVTVLVLLLPT